MRYVTFLLLGLAATMPAVFCGCGGGSQRPNVVLITIDALRPDHLSAYGYNRPTSPFLDSLAAKGCVFSNCHSVACWTAPSIASIFTSVHPRSHGVLHGFAREKQIHGQELLAPAFLTLAEALRARGYATYGIAGTGHVTAQSGLAQGFDKFNGLWFPPCELLHNAALDLKADLEKQKPFFLWIHYFTPHAPYYARKPWIDRYARHPGLVPEFSRKPADWLHEQVPRMNASADIRETIVDLYDAEINFVDGFVERLFKEVLPRGNTLVIISSDHGEMLFEHGSFGHAQSLFEEEIKVPLVIVPPAAGTFKAKTVGAQVSSLDLYPTILDLLGIANPPGLQGQSLKPLLDGGEPVTNRHFFAEFDRGTLPLRSITLRGWKFISFPGGAIDGMLFDLNSDPGETNNLISLKPDVAGSLKRDLLQWMEANKPFEAPRGSVQLTPEQEKILKSLGYIR